MEFFDHREWPAALRQAVGTAVQEKDHKQEQQNNTNITFLFKF